MENRQEFIKHLEQSRQGVKQVLTKMSGMLDAAHNFEELGATAYATANHLAEQTQLFAAVCRLAHLASTMAGIAPATDLERLTREHQEILGQEDSQVYTEEEILALFTSSIDKVQELGDEKKRRTIEMMHVHGDTFTSELAKLWKKGSDEQRAKIERAFADTILEHASTLD